MAEWIQYPGGVYKTKGDLYREFKEKREKIMRLGDAKVLEKRREAGQLNARERLEYLLGAWRKDVKDLRRKLSLRKKKE